MRKILFILAGVAIAAMASAQTTVGSWTAFAGAAGDTLTASATKTYTLALNKYQVDSGVNVQVWLDAISGTTTCSIKCYWSNDGVNIPAAAADSASKSHASDFVYMKNFATAGGRYLIVKAIATSATQKEKIYGWANVYSK